MGLPRYSWSEDRCVVSNRKKGFDRRKQTHVADSNECDGENEDGGEEDAEARLAVPRRRLEDAVGEETFWKKCETLKKKKKFRKSGKYTHAEV